MDTHLPSYLYKYASLQGRYKGGGDGQEVTGFDAVADILTRNRIYYSDPRLFNDPFEFDRVVERLPHDDCIALATCMAEDATAEETGEPAAGRLRPPQLAARLLAEWDRIEADLDAEDSHSIIQRTGYISLCDTNDSVLMWSHYADRHKGLCLRFVCRQDPFYEENGSGRYGAITYGDSVETIELTPDGSTEATLHRIFRKAKCWEYEREYRVYRLPSSRTADDAQGNADFNSELVDAVYFGLRTPEPDMEKVQAIVARAKHDITVYRARKDGRSMRLTFDPIAK